VVWTVVNELSKVNAYDSLMGVLMLRFGGESMSPPVGNLATTLAANAGAQSFELLQRMQQAQTRVQQDFVAALTSAYENQSSGYWQDVTTTYPGENGLTETSTTRVFSLQAFSDWYATPPTAAQSAAIQSGQAPSDADLSRWAFTSLYGRVSGSPTIVETYNDESNIHSSPQLNLAGLAVTQGGEAPVYSVSTSGLSLAGVATLNVNAAPRLHSNAVVEWHPTLGWVTPTTNIYVKPDFIDRVSDFLDPSNILFPSQLSFLMPPGFDAVISPIRTLLAQPQSLLNNLVVNSVNPLVGLFDGGLRGAWVQTVAGLRDVALAPIRSTVDVTARVFNALIVINDAASGSLSERGLTSDEAARMRAIYGDSIEYSRVRIQRGGLRERLDRGEGRANTFDNSIWMPQEYYDSTGRFTDEGMALLAHELCHVWQYQNYGPEYLSSAVQTYATRGRSGGPGTGGSYDFLVAVREGRGFSEMLPDEQAELVQYMFPHVDSSGNLNLAPFVE
jgi:hypothetical protein